MRNTCFHIGAGAALFAAGALIILDSETLISLAVSVFIHELGHITALVLLGANINRITAGAAGLEIQYSGRLSYGAEVISAAAGPIAGVIGAVISYILLRRTGIEIYSLIGGISTLLSLFNLLPVGYLDGGRMLFHLSAPFIGGERAEVIVRAAGAATIIAVAAAGLILTLHTHTNFSVLLCAFIMAIYYCKNCGSIIKF